DQAWLDALNVERQKRLLDKISYEVFEVVIDRLEKEWFNLAKLILKPGLAFPSDDSCAICDELEGENNNAIVFCDGCNVAVHQADCYGVPYIPEGQWLCRPCSVSPGTQVSCILCPNSGGAFKQTTQGEWIHLLCAIWVPETFVSNDVFMEPVIGIEDISKQRWKLKCSICTRREGACIQCVKQSCFLAFHVTCARKSKLLFPMRSTQGSELHKLACFCERHLPVCFSRHKHFWH
ncbi:PHD-zinc-finger like domain-containing protein, partial [Mycena leptocephala]